MENNSKDRFKDIFIVLTIFCMIILAIFFLVIQPIINKVDEAQETVSEINVDDYFLDGYDKGYEAGYMAGFKAAENPTILQEIIAKNGTDGLNKEITDPAMDKRTREEILAKYGVTPRNNYDKDKIKSVDNSRVKTSVND